jgi:hypothetical protein
MSFSENQKKSSRMRIPFKRISVTCMVLFSFSSFSINPSAAAQGQFGEEEAKIPQTTTTPPQMLRRSPKDVPHCERYFECKNKKAEVDSNLGYDAETLKFTVKDTPAALAELNIYQENRQQIKAAAYIGTLGLLMIGTGLIVGEGAGPYLFYGGIAVAGTFYVYGLNKLRVNESHIENAVRYYNMAHPEKRIQLQFSTEFNF